MNKSEVVEVNASRLLNRLKQKAVIPQELSRCQKVLEARKQRTNGGNAATKSLSSGVQNYLSDNRLY